MNKKTIAVLFGGHSSEYSVSLHSAHAVLTGLNTEKYDIIPIGITREGDWYRYCGDPEKLMDDTWADDPAALIPTVVSPNRSVHGILEFPSKSSFCPDSPDGSGRVDADSGQGAADGSFRSGRADGTAAVSGSSDGSGRADAGVRTTRIDFAFPVLHGKCGEDGTVQGVFELAGIPVIGCGTLSSALCMDKDRAHRLAALAGIAAPKAVTISCFERDNAAALTACLTYPLFVKPVRAGSSYGISRISGPNELSAALDLAFSHDSEVIIEENVEGFEVGCAVVGINELFVGRVDEIELDHGFFDYAEKYERASAVIHMPARIDPDTETRIQNAAKIIYRALGCSGFARVDLFLTPDGRIVFNEVNSIPGLTAMSRFPTMMKGAGLSFGELLDMLTGLYDK
ncbi:MAG: D-alanine--D-alanine ligase [Roseburia sp.]|jgi:D-alanine---D-serine ligase|nr:D-alanine--D-alanine ligase [Roseburia sp.]